MSEVEPLNEEQVKKLNEELVRTRVIPKDACAVVVLAIKKDVLYIVLPPETESTLLPSVVREGLLSCVNAPFWDELQRLAGETRPSPADSGPSIPTADQLCPE